MCFNNLYKMHRKAWKTVFLLQEKLFTILILMILLVQFIILNKFQEKKVNQIKGLHHHLLLNFRDNNYKKTKICYLIEALW
jgi:hypothetical protein